VTRRVIAFAVLWLALLAAGAYRCYVFATTPGRAAPAPVTWPVDSTLPRATATPTIVMFAHPDCACTAASLVELADLVAELAPRPRVLIVFTGAHDPRASANWDTAGRIADAIRLRDDGREARRFGAQTSGYALVYDARGIRRFAGGLTGARGHVGDNVGRRAAAAALRGTAGEPSHGVFGCSLEAE